MMRRACSGVPPPEREGRAVYVNRLRLLNVKPLHGDIPEGGGALPKPARRRLVLQGANGSGKSTILETILTLWKFWGEWIEEGRGSAPPEDHLHHYLAKADLAAIEIVDMPDASWPLWIGMGKRSEWRALRDTHPRSFFAGLIRDETGWNIELPREAERPEPDNLLTLRHRSLAGSESFPNIVYFPPEGRTIRPPEKLRGEIIDTTGFHWAAVYDPAVSLDSVLLDGQGAVSRALRGMPATGQPRPGTSAEANHGLRPQGASGRGRHDRIGELPTNTRSRNCPPASGKCCCWSASPWRFCGRAGLYSLMNPTCTSTSGWWISYLRRWNGSCRSGKGN